MTQLSIVKGETDSSLIESPIGAFFDEACALHAHVDALISRHQNLRLTYGELRRKVDALVYLTDGYGTFPDDPGYPVIWGDIAKNPAYPFGQVVEVPRA